MNQPYNTFPPAAPRNSTMALVSLISGIVSWFLLPFIAAIVAVITGHMAKSEIKKSNGMVTGNGMATAGLILGYVQLGLGVCAIFVIAVLAILGPVISNTIQ
jgi:hypothetical protein